MPDTLDLTASLEDYVEAIYNIAVRKGAARVTDIALELSVAKSSVTGALRSLSSKGLVNYDPYSIITLTPDGEEVGERIARRHAVLAEFLEEILGLSAEVAQANACRIEHSMEPAVVMRLLKFIDFIEKCPRAGEDFRAGFKRFYEGGDAPYQCVECLGRALEAAEETSSAPCRAGGAESPGGRSNEDRE